MAQTFSIWVPYIMTRKEATVEIMHLAQQWNNRYPGSICAEEIVQKIDQIYNARTIVLTDVTGTDHTFTPCHDGSVEMTISHDEPRDA